MDGGISFSRNEGLQAGWGMWLGCVAGLAGRLLGLLGGWLDGLVGWVWLAGCCGWLATWLDGLVGWVWLGSESLHNDDFNGLI